MKLIADSGSTKTDWRLIQEGEVIAEFETEGINPYLKTREAILDLLKDLATRYIKTLENIDVIYFYGAGCALPEKKEQLANCFQTIFSTAKVYVYHDLLGAAIATCGNKAGVVAILGTGSNSCVFDGTQIIAEQNSLGYVLGDEGAGSQIGKLLLKDFLYQQMPIALAKQLQADFNLNKASVLDNVYKKPFPNRYMASFVKWIGNYIEKEEYLQRLVLKAFDDFFATHLTKYDVSNELPVNVVGSVGYYFKEYLYITAFKYEMKIGRIIQKPIDRLVEFNLK